MKNPDRIVGAIRPRDGHVVAQHGNDDQRDQFEPEARLVAGDIGRGHGPDSSGPRTLRLERI